MATARPVAACTGTKQCWERGKKSCGVLIASYYSGPFSCNPHHRQPVHSVPKHGPCLSIVPQHKCHLQRLQRLQRLQSLQLVMFIDSGWTAVWLDLATGHPVPWWLWCRNAMCCYHLFMGRGDIRGHCYGDQATDLRPPSPAHCKYTAAAASKSIKTWSDQGSAQIL